MLWCSWSDVPQAPSFSPRLLEGLSQTLEDIRLVLGYGEFAGLDSLGMERIVQHGFPCRLRHPAACGPESAVLCRLTGGPADQALEGELCPGLLSQFPQLRVGAALPPRSMGGAVALGWRVRVAWVCVVGSWGLVAVAGPGESL